MSFQKAGLWVLFLIFPSLTFAYIPKEGNITGMMGPFTGRTYFENSSSRLSAPYFGGFGIMVVGDLNDKGSLEIMMLQMNKLYIREQSGKYLGVQTQLMHIAMGYRRWISPSFSMSLSITSAYTMGDAQVVRNDFAVADQMVTSANDLTVYGCDLSFQVDLLSNDKYTLVFNGRYSRALAPKPGEVPDHYGAILGIRWLIQERYPSKDKTN